MNENVEQGDRQVPPNLNDLSEFQLKVYRRAGLTDDEIHEWVAAGISPYQCEGYRSTGVGLDLAVELKARGINGNVVRMVGDIPPGTSMLAAIEARVAIYQSDQALARERQADQSALIRAEQLAAEADEEAELRRAQQERRARVLADNGGAEVELLWGDLRGFGEHVVTDRATVEMFLDANHEDDEDGDLETLDMEEYCALPGPEFEQFAVPFGGRVSDGFYSITASFEEVRDALAEVGYRLVAEPELIRRCWPDG